MAELVITNGKLLFGGYDFSGNMNALAINAGAEILDKTTIGATSRQRIAGLKTMEMQHEGFWSAGTGEPDGILFGKVGGTSDPMTISPTSGADGDDAFISSVLVGEYSPGGAIGEVMPFSVSAELNEDELVRGTVMHNATRTAGGSGTARQLGAVGATQKLYAALHITSITGGTLTVTVESDNASGMTSPITQATFTAATAIGGEWLAPIAGAIADDWWRVSWTYTGTTVDFIVSIGIL